MDDEELESADMLTYITDELLRRFSSAEDDANRAAVVENFLQRYENDTKLEALKKMHIEFEKDLDWFNVSQPLTLHGLRGKFVILDFFTYCCINCMHVLSELHRLEELFSVERGMVVIGVHSPKFQNEKDGANILSAAQRYGIEHPIVNDPNSSLWRALDIRCWPSLLVLSPSGAPLLLLLGEGKGAFLEVFMEQALQYYGKKQEIANFPVPLIPSRDLMPASNLRFPAKITRSEDGRFAIADAGNNRILVVDNKGIVQHKVGGCVAGFIDGDLQSARFNSPQGVVFFNSDVLIVADTENHALRKVVLSANKVETLAGTGHQGNDRVGGKLGPMQALSSPWDVAVYQARDMDMSFHLDERNVPEKTFVLASMAGTHQIWAYFPEGIIWWKFKKFEPQTCSSLIGNGLEENRNNSYPQNAGFAQPSGLAIADKFLFIADSESSSIRKVSMVDGKVTAVVGGDRNPLNLFAFGDVDGKQFNAKLQHPLAVAYNHMDEKVYVADTYNHKIKVVDPISNTIETLPIKTEAGALYKFKEPAGLCFDSSCNELLVADTNNHVIVSVDMQTLISKPFNLNFHQSLLRATETDASKPNQTMLQLQKKLPLKGCVELKLRIVIEPEDNLKFTAGAPQKWALNVNNAGFHATNLAGKINEDGTLYLNLKRQEATAPSGPEDIKLHITLSLCDAVSCFIKQFTLLLVDNSGDSGGTGGNEIIDEISNIAISPNEIRLR